MINNSTNITLPNCTSHVNNATYENGIIDLMLRRGSNWLNPMQTLKNDDVEWIGIGEIKILPAEPVYFYIANMKPSSLNVLHFTIVTAASNHPTCIGHVDDDEPSWCNQTKRINMQSDIQIDTIDHHSSLRGFKAFW